VRCCVATIALLVLLSSSVARAELSGRNSLELIVAEATTVVYASVEDGGTLRVLKMIKGSPRQSLAIESLDGALRDAAAGDHVLLFLDADGKPLSSSRQSGVVRLNGPQRAFVFDVRWEMLFEEDDIVRAATEAARWPTTMAIAIDEPPTMTITSYVRFPVDARLERAARDWPRSTHAQQIAEALRQFHSPQNAAILRSLLNERGDVMMQGAGRLWSVSYPVPDLAWHTLESWGEHVPRPVMTLPDDAYRPVRWYVIVLAGALFLAPAAVALMIVKKRRWLGAVATLLGTLTLLMIVSWARSGEIVDELFVDRADRQLWISSVDGWFQITRIPDWRGRVARDRYVPLGEELDGLAAADVESATPHLHPPRGWMIGAIPLQPMRQLWFGPPTRVTRDDDWRIAKMLSGFDVTTYGPDKPPLAVQRFQIRWVVLIAAFGTWPAAWIGIGVYRELRSRRRRARGRCVGCGYDLRGSDNAGGGRCPECGLTFSS
jgi:hypothetical protein